MKQGNIADKLHKLCTPETYLRWDLFEVSRGPVCLKANEDTKRVVYHR